MGWILFFIFKVSPYCSYIILLNASSNELIIFYKNNFFYILNKTLIHREKAPIIIKKMNKDNFFKRFNHIDMINNGGKNPLVKCGVLPFF